MKRYLRKIGALLLTFIMALSMCTSVFAVTKNSATITVSNAEGATLSYAQVIKPDRTTETGWAFTSPEIGEAYKTAFGVTHVQDAIKAMIPANKVDAQKLGAAQAAAANVAGFVTMTNPKTVTEAGVYLIKATETGFTYNIMAAYIGFGEVTIDGTTYEYPSLTDAKLEAKKTPTQVIKTVEDSDNVTHTGDVLTYTVKTNVPYIAPTDTDNTFWVYDELTGAEYTETATAKITLAGNDITSGHSITFNEAKTQFQVNLSDLINTANSNAGKEVVIIYKVKVTSANDTITNTAKAGHKDGEQYGNKTVTTYEGNIILTKTSEDCSEKLAGAGFEVRKDSKTTEPLKFTKLEDGVYKYDPSGNVTMVETGTAGTVKIQGLDVGTYYFKEIQAPKGYSINKEEVHATLEVKEEGGIASKVLTADTSMKDTKLSELPSTGGTGTYIFTVLGVMVMTGVAGMFLISRRKENE